MIGVLLGGLPAAPSPTAAVLLLTVLHANTATLVRLFGSGPRRTHTGDFGTPRLAATIALHFADRLQPFPNLGPRILLPPAAHGSTTSCQL